MTSPVQVFVHRGSHQIGRSCVEMAFGRHRLLIDGGSPLDDSQPSELPPIPGVSLPGLAPAAVLLSHAHADHSGLLGRIPREVPVWMTSGTSKMLLAGEVFCGQPSVPRDLQRKLPPGKPARIGDFTVTALPVDHPIFGAVAFLIEVAGRRVLYSGDLRLHGRKPGMSRSLVEAATTAPLDLLLIEGTHLSRGAEKTTTTEWALEEQISNLVGNAPGLVLAFFSPQHLDRLVTFYKAARRAGRTLVIDFYTAFVMHLLRSEAGIPDPGRGAGLRVYFLKRHPRVPQLEARLAVARITQEEVLNEPSRYVLLSRPGMLKRDLSGRLPDKTLGLYSMWSGYLGRPEWLEARIAIKATGGRLTECHTSGHASVPDLLRLIRELKPRRIVPVHTEQPKMLKQLVRGVELAKDGQAIYL